MSLSVKEPERTVDCVHETDLVVVGGSCTGVFAAVRAARLGAFDWQAAAEEHGHEFEGVQGQGVQLL